MPLVISCSLNPASRSRRLAEAACAACRERGAAPDFMDLRDHAIPFCAGGGTPVEPALRDRIARAEAILLAVPIYNYDVNAAAKNLVELTGRAWNEKLVGFLCAAGGRGSYMSVMGLANSLMLDFRCLVIPRFVYASRADFLDDASPPFKPEVGERIEELCAHTLALAGAIASLSPSEKT